MANVIATEGNLVLVDFGSAAQERPVTKRRLAAILGKSERWIEYRMAEGMPYSTDRRGRRIFIPSECRGWLASREQKGVQSA